MRFLADESCDHAVVRALRSDGHDVLAVSEIQQRSVDAEVSRLARTERRILLTEDKDFGWLVVVAERDSPGVILIRYPADARSKVGSAVTALAEEHGSRLERAFVVLRPGSARIGRVPPITSDVGDREA